MSTGDFHEGRAQTTASTLFEICTQMSLQLLNNFCSLHCQQKLSIFPKKKNIFRVLGHTQTNYTCTHINHISLESLLFILSSDMFLNMSKSLLIYHFVGAGHIYKEAGVCVWGGWGETYILWTRCMSLVCVCYARPHLYMNFLQISDSDTWASQLND